MSFLRRLEAIKIIYVQLGNYNFSAVYILLIIFIMETKHLFLYSTV